MHQHRRYGRIHAPRKRADGSSLLSYRLLNLAYALFHEVLWGPGAAGAANVINKIAQQIDPVPGVMNFGMKLHRPNPASFVFYRRQGVTALGHHLEPLR